MFGRGVTVITKGDGIYVYDQDGNRYIDLDSGVTRPVHLGYGRRELAQAAYDQMCELAYYYAQPIRKSASHAPGRSVGRDRSW